LIFISVLRIYIFMLNRSADHDIFALSLHDALPIFQYSNQTVVKLWGTKDYMTIEQIIKLSYLLYKRRINSNMAEREKMISGKLYKTSDPELVRLRELARNASIKYNQ